MKYIIALTVIALMTACSTAPAPVLFENSRTYDTSREVVWKKLNFFFQSSAIPVKIRDKKRGVLVAIRHLERGSIYADCGTSDVSSVRDGVLTVKISLQSLNKQRTRATIDVTFTGKRSFAGLSNTAIECFSNGTLEEEILKNL